jgi:hypothetical protein
MEKLLRLGCTLNYKQQRNKVYQKRHDASDHDTHMIHHENPNSGRAGAGSAICC